MPIRYDPRVQDAIRNLAPEPKKALKAAIRLIAKDPRSADVDWKVLETKGPEIFFRARVGEYRIIYLVRPGELYVDRVIHRREGYGWLERG